MLRSIDRAADFADARSHAGRSLVMHHADCLDSVFRIRRQARANRLGVGAVSPVSRQKLSDQTQTGRKFLPERRELTGFAHQHQVSG